jgi:diguanylate cyclase (GGDEF)-like protein
MSFAMVDLGEAPALPADRRRAAVVAGILLAGSLLIVPVISRPLGASYPIFAIVIALSVAAFAITSLLLWAQSRVTESVPLTLLALGYELTSIVMIPYLLFYRGLWPQLIAWSSADPQTSGWMWVEWHGLFICSAIAYYIARRSQAPARERDAQAFRRLQQRFLFAGAAFLLLTVPPLIWLDGLPQLSVNGVLTPLFNVVSVTMSVGAAAAIVLAYRTSRFRSLLDLWLAVACFSMFADVTLQHFARQFTAGWYASRVSILLAASAVLWVLLSQTATIYAQLAVTAERLRNESLTDALTGLANRRSFDQRFAEMLRDCARETRPLALLMIDVDHFKVYNDTFGHQRGDDALRAIGGLLLHNATRARDLVARIGGEEIAVIMPQVDLLGALVVAERMRIAIQSAGMAQGSGAKHPVVTISVGVTATTDPSGTTVEDLVRSADRALYRAKDMGRNRVIELGEPLVFAGLPDA